LLGVLPAAVYACDADGVITYFNDQAAEVWGQTPQIGDRDRRFCGSFRLSLPDGTPLPHEETPMAAALREGRSTRGAEVVMERPDGSRVTVSVNIDPVRDDAGEIVGAINVFTDISEQKQAERAVRESAEFTRRVIDNLFAFVGVLEPDGTLLEANQAPLQAAGITMDDVRGRKFWDCFWWSYDEAVQRQLEDACRRAAEGETVRYDVDVRMADDGRLTIDFQIVPLRDSVGRITHLIPSAVDISERKQAETKLRESERRFRLMADGLPLMVWVHDADGQQAFVNQTFCDFFGVEREEMTGEKWKSLVHPEDAERYARAFAEAVRQRTSFNTEVRVRNANGEWRWLESWGQPRLGDDGAFAGFVGTSADVTARKEAQAALRESEERFRRLADAMPQLVWTAEPDGAVDYYNVRVQQYEGFCFDKERGWQWQACLHPDDEQRTVEAWRHALASGEEYRVEHRVRQRPRDGEQHGPYRWLLSRAVPVRNAAGQIIKWYGTATDIEATRQAQQELRESEERFQIAKRAARLGIFDYNVASGEITWDERVRELWGVGPEEEITYDLFMQGLHPDDREATRQAVDRALDPAGDGVYEAVYRVINRRDGITRWIEATGQTSFQNGKPLRLVGTVQDVSVERDAEVALRQSEQRFKRMADTAPAMLWVTDTDHQCTFLSHGWEEFTGQPVAEGHDMGWTNMVHPEDLEAAREQFLEAAEAREAFLLEYRLRTHEGSYRWCIDAGRPRFDEDGAFEGYIGSVIDIHDHKRIERELRQKEERLRLATEATGLGAYDFHPPIDKLAWSRQLFRLYGLPQGEAPALETVLGCVHEDDRDLFRRTVEAVTRPDGPEEYDLEFRIRRADDGHIRWLRDTGRALAVGEGDQRRVYRVLGMVLDITERKSTEVELRLARDEMEQRVEERTAELRAQTEQLRSLAGQLASAEQRERRRLAAILHDDLQQWLVAAKMRLGPLSSKSVDPKIADVPAKVREMLDEAIKCSRNLSQELRPPVLYEEGLLPALRWLAEQMHERHELDVEVTAEVEEEPASEDLAAFLFESVREMLFNIVKHAGVSEASVHVRRTNGTLEVVVEDGGTGFDLDAIQRQGGGGLGLFSVRERLAGLGGEMEITSTPGEGTRITLCAPVADNAEADESPPGIHTRAPRQAPLFAGRQGEGEAEELPS
jgi:PAS domain S-box-containing protein